MTPVAINNIPPLTQTKDITAAVVVINAAQAWEIVSDHYSACTQSPDTSIVTATRLINGDVPYTPPSKCTPFALDDLLPVFLLSSATVIFVVVFLCVSLCFIVLFCVIPSIFDSIAMSLSILVHQHLSLSFIPHGSGRMTHGHL